MNINKEFNLVWDESTRMPFGKWKGECLANVPDSYFRWLYKQEWIHKWESLCDYIEGLDLMEDDDED